MKNGLKIISLTGLLLILAGLNSAFGQDWPQWRGSQRDGKIVGFTAPATWPEKLAQEWKINVGYGDATPALVKGKLYVYTRQEGNEVLQCLDASNGKVLWKEGYPAVMITDTAFYRNHYYHTFEDTAEKLDYQSMSEVVRGIYFVVFELAR